MNKKQELIDYSVPKNIEKLIQKWRKTVGIDPVYVIQFIESPEDTGYPAWVDGLNSDNPHPTANIFINSNWLQKYKYDEKRIVGIIVHELIHIVVTDAFMIIDPQYKYKGVKARANEVLTMKLTNAIMETYYNT